MHDMPVPTDLLFAYLSHHDSSGLTGVDVARMDCLAVPIVVLPIMQMIDSAVKGDIDAYYRHCLACGTCPPAVSDMRFLQDFRRMTRSFRWNPFGRRPVISAIEHDCLIVSQGVELCCLAKVFGKAWMKVSLPEEIEARWLTRDTRDLENVVARTSRKVFYNPIDHPAYRKARIARRDSVRLDRIRQLLGPLGPGLCGLDIGCNMGYTSHHLQRQGFRMTGIDFDENHLAVARALNATYGLEVRFENCYFRQFEADGPFDVTVALTVLYHMFYRQEEQEIPEHARMERTAALQKIDALTRHALIWESGPEPQREIDFICSNSGLREYHSLGLTRGTGKKRELGVFLRPGTEMADYLKRRCRQRFLW